MSAIGALSVNEEHLALQSILRKQGNASAQSIAAYSVEPMVSEDYPALEMVLKTLGRENDAIQLIEVTQNGRVVARYGHTINEPALAFHSDIVLHNTARQDQTLGAVKLLVSEHENQAIIAKRVKSLVINLFIAFMLLSLILRYLLSHMVVKRISTLKHLTEQFIATELAGTIPQYPARKSSHDEIDVLRERFVTMLDGLQSRDAARAAMLSELAAARTLLVDVANAMPSALIVVTRDGTISFCNRAALTAIGNPDTPLVGQPLRTALPYQETEYETILNEVRNQHTLKRLPLRKLIDEQMHFFEAAIYPLSESASGGAVIRIDDVTERVRIQEAMVQTEKMASVGSLAAGVAHEINNPLGVMVQAAQNIERRTSESLAANHRIAEECGTTIGTIRAYLEKREILDFLNDIKSDGARASKIVRSLLEFSRRSGAIRDMVLIEELFSQTIELAQKDYDLKKNIDFRQIRVSVEVDPALPPVPMMRSQIEQVLLNLLKNSAQAIAETIASDPAFTPHISLRAKQEAGYARLEVQDNGPGFSAETRRRAFEPFFTTKPPGIGTGLGLWISYAIVIDKHGGEMMLDSAPGKGCTFILKLPLKSGDVA